MDDLIFRVEIRGPQHSLNDTPATSSRIFASAILKDEFKLLPTAQIRSHHLSFERFRELINLQTELTFNVATDEMGYVQFPNRPDNKQQWGLVQDELSFQNAIAVMRNNTVLGMAMEDHMFYLFSPKPQKSLFKHPKRALAPGIVSQEASLQNLSLIIQDSDDRFVPSELGSPMPQPSRPSSPKIALHNSPAQPNTETNTSRSNPFVLSKPEIIMLDRSASNTPTLRASSPSKLEALIEGPSTAPNGSAKSIADQGLHSAATDGAGRGEALDLGAAFLESKVAHVEQQEGESDEDFRLRQEEEAALEAELMNQR